MQTHEIGFIGLGRMGAGMAANLLNARVPLAVFDRRRAPVDALVARGATTGASPGEIAARVQRLFLCLPSDKEVEEVLFGEAGAIASAREGMLVIDTTTMNRGAALELAARCVEAGVPYQDCPISGMPFRAENGTLTMMFGGSEEAFQDARPYLDIMGEFIVHCGGVGSGQLMKAVNNIIYNVNIAAICEVMPLAIKAGLGAETLAEVLTTASARSFASEYFVPRILERRFDTDFSLATAYKDIVNVQETAERLGVETPVVDAMIATYRAAMDMGFGDEPKSAMVKVYEQRMGQKVTRG